MNDQMSYAASRQNDIERSRKAADRAIHNLNTPGYRANRFEIEELCNSVRRLLAIIQGEDTMRAEEMRVPNAELLQWVKQYRDAVQYHIGRAENEGDDEGARLKTLTLNLLEDVIERAEPSANLPKVETA